MQAVNEYPRGTLFREQFYPTQSQTIIERNLGHFSVDPGGLVSGNGKDPNQWSYDVEDVIYFKGGPVSDFTGSRLDKTETGVIGGSAGNEIPYIPTWDRDLLYDMALSKFVERVRGTLDMSVNAAQAGATRRMLTSAHKLHGKARGTKGIAKAWLTYRYGWMPLLGDIFGAAEESMRISEHEIQRIRARATLPIEVSLKREVLFSGHYFDSYVKGAGKQSCTFSAHLRVDGFDWARWTSLNPFTLGWELIPYSFVVDWVFDVGTYLRNFDTALMYNKQFVNGYVSELFAYDGEDEIQAGASQTNQFGNTTTIGGPVKGAVRSRYFRRLKLTSFPLPRLPVIRANLGWKNLFTIWALMKAL